MTSKHQTPERGPAYAPSKLERAFREFHAANPHVYELFKRFAFEAIESGASKLGAGDVWERMRWHSRVETKGDEYRLNNNHRAYYARMFERDFPDHEGVFAKRRVKRGPVVPEGTQLEIAPT